MPKGPLRQVGITSRRFRSKQVYFDGIDYHITIDVTSMLEYFANEVLQRPMDKIPLRSLSCELATRAEISYDEWEYVVGELERSRILVFDDGLFHQRAPRRVL